MMIKSIKYAMCNTHVHNNEKYSKYFLYNGWSFIMFDCGFTYNLLYDVTSVDVILWFWVTSQKR